MGKKGHMPPGVTAGAPLKPTYPGSTYPITTDCVNITDTYCLEFDDSGLFAYFPSGYFKDADGNDLQSGYFTGGSTNGPYWPQSIGSVILIFVDFDALETYVEILSITEDCALGTDECT